MFILTNNSNKMYSLINMSQLQILFNWPKTWHWIVCLFSWIYLFLPVLAWCDHKIVLLWSADHNAHNVRIRLAQLNFFVAPWRKKQKFQLCQSYSYVMRKVWCHQIWIQNILVFMVLILMYVWFPTISSPKYSGQKTFSHQPIKTLENWQKKETSISSNFIHSRNVQIDNLYYWARFQWWANFWLLYVFWTRNCRKPYLLYGT